MNDILTNSKLVSYTNDVYFLPLGDYRVVHYDRELLHEREFIKGDVCYFIFAKEIDKLFFYYFIYFVRLLVLITVKLEK